MVVCDNCGTKNVEEEIFCQGCGKELKWSKIKDVTYSNKYNPNLFSSSGNERGIIEILSIRNWEDLVLLISLVLNIVVPLLFYDFNSQPFASTNNFFILIAVVVLLLLSLYEPKDIGIRMIMILINFYYFEFALFTSNIVLLLIAVYQISIKAFNSQFYSVYSNLYKVDQNKNSLKIALFLIYFSIPRILQGPEPFISGGFQASGWYTIWVCIFTFIFLLIAVNKPWERLTLFKKMQ